ncbi:MAG: MlaD family protein, partial [Deltaproteobacteria bacterium]|nr:MlaD family protein [Deltaproteobacteria bacterium]
MAAKSTYFKVGLFALVAFFVLAAAILFFGISQSFVPLLTCETYFDHSVQGLSNGSSVQFRGFKVGQVSSISLARESSNPGSQQLVKVTFTINPELITGSKVTVEAAREFLENEIAQGLRIFFSFQGISGISQLNLDYETPAQGTTSVNPVANGETQDPGPMSPTATRGETQAGKEDSYGDYPEVIMPSDALLLTSEKKGTLLIPSAPGTIME